MSSSLDLRSRTWPTDTDRTLASLSSWWTTGWTSSPPRSCWANLLPPTWVSAWPPPPSCSPVSSSRSWTSSSSGGSASRGTSRRPSSWSASQRDWDRPSCWPTSTRTPPWRASARWTTRRTKRSSHTSQTKLSAGWTEIFHNNQCFINKSVCFIWNIS